MPDVTLSLPFVKSFLANEVTSIRLTAFAAWYKLAEQEKDEIAAMALRDDATRIIKFSLQLVHKRGAFIPVTMIQARLLEKRHVDLLMQFTRHLKWDHLESITRLALACSVEERAALQLEAHLRDWCRLCRRGWYESTKPAQFAFLASHASTQALQRLLPDGQEIGAYLRQELIR